MKTSEPTSILLRGLVLTIFIGFLISAFAKAGIDLGVLLLFLALPPIALIGWIIKELRGIGHGY